ncbi:hypothetical protein V2K54_04560 [Pseudomonas alliivorans]|nr:hypothetical protein [Pseudomonas alliivorans]
MTLKSHHTAPTLGSHRISRLTMRDERMLQMIRVLLSLDLIDSEDQREDFYKFLKSKVWFKTKDVDTVWTIRYPKADPEKDSAYAAVKLNIKNTLIEAATKFKIKKIRYVAQIGNKEYIAKSVMKDGNEYQQFNRELYAE